MSLDRGELADARDAVKDALEDIEDGKAADAVGPLHSVLRSLNAMLDDAS